MTTRARRDPRLTSVPVAEHDRIRRIRVAEQWEASRRRPVAVPRPRREPDTPLAVRRTDARPPGGRLRGRPPYGYQVVVVQCPDGPAHVLEPDDRTAPVVRRIFTDYLAGHGLQRIAEGLTADTVPCPSAHDRSRTRTTAASPGPRARSGRSWSTRATHGLSQWDAASRREPAGAGVPAARSSRASSARCSRSSR